MVTRHPGSVNSSSFSTGSMTHLRRMRIEWMIKRGRIFSSLSGNKLLLSLTGTNKELFPRNEISFFTFKLTLLAFQKQEESLIPHTYINIICALIISQLMFLVSGWLTVKFHNSSLYLFFHVGDRLLLWIFVVATIGATFGILYMSPHTKLFTT